MKKIKLMFVLGGLFGGGAERIVCNLLKGLDRKIFEVNLFLLYNKGESAYWNMLPDDVNVYIGSKSSKIKAFKNLYKVTKKENIDILIGSVELTVTYLVVIIGYLLNIKTVGWVHINIDSILKNAPNKINAFLHKNIFIKLFYNRINKIIAVSYGAKKNIQKYIFNKEKVICIYNPIDIKYIRNKGFEEIKEDFKHPVVIGIGRLEKQKNFANLIKAHKILLNKGIRHELIILGQGTEKDFLKNLIIDLGLEKSVKLLGFKDNPYSYLSRADIFVQSSLFEGLPTVIIEALALNIPVVATDCPDGAREILKDGEYGILVKNNDIKALADGIEILLVNKYKYNYLKNKSKKAIEPFNYDYIVKNFEGFFIKVYINS